MENENIIYLADEDGNELGFEFLELIEYEGQEYVVLLPTDEEDNELVILRVEAIPDSEEENFFDVMDEDILNAVFDIFKENHKDEIDFGE